MGMNPSALLGSPAGRATGLISAFVACLALGDFLDLPITWTRAKLKMIAVGEFVEDSRPPKDESMKTTYLLEGIESIGAAGKCELKGF